MTLHELLNTCNRQTRVGIYNMDTPFDKSYKSRQRYEILPTPQTYSKIANIPYGRIRHFLDYDVVGIAHNETGLYIQIASEYGKERIKQRQLARDIAKSIKEGENE